MPQYLLCQFNSVQPAVKLQISINEYDENLVRQIARDGSSTVVVSTQRASMSTNRSGTDEKTDTERQ